MRFWLQLAGTIVLVLALVWVTDWREALAILAQARPRIVLFSLFLCVIGLIMSAIRWNVLLRAHGIVISNYAATRYYWIGSFAGNYLPSNIGGDVVRAVVMKRSGRLAQIGASIVVERMTGLAIVLALVAPSLLFRSNYYSVKGLLPLVWLGVAGLTAALLVVVFFGGQVANRLERWGSKEGSLLRRGVDKLRKLVGGVHYYRHAKGAILLTMLWAILFYANMIAFNYFVLAAVGARLPWLEVLLVAPIIPLISFLPISINNIGVTEGAFVFFYSQAGVSTEAALAAAVLMRILMMFTTLLGGLFWLQNKTD